MSGGSRMPRAFRDNSGLSAVEFALIAPILGFLVLASYDAVNFAGAFTSMQRAERAGIQYFMNGGTNMDVVKGVVGTAWKSPPPNYTVTADEVCKCGDAVTTCGSGGLCAAGSYSANMIITAAGTVKGLLISLPESKSETVRVQ